MSTAVEEQKPVVPVEASTVEPTPAPVVIEKPIESVEPKVEEPAKTEEPAVPTVEEKKEVKPAEPILSGPLGYKAPGLKNAFRFSKKHFWFTEEPVSTESLTHYLRGEKPEVAHATAAWSNKTGKGLVYFVKHADQTATPAGVLNLSEATEVTKDGFTTFFVKIAGHKHTFETQTTKERDGWLVSFEKAVAEAKELKDEIINSEEYKEAKATLSKPTALATHTPVKEATPKKSTDVAPKLAEAESSTAAETAAPARTGSASSSSSDEEKRKKKASKSKSRSVSRGKRTSIFGSFLGKKEKAEEKVEEKKEEKKEESDAKKEETPVPATTTTIEPTPVVAPVVGAPVITEDLPKPVAEESKTEETPAPVVEAAAPAEEKKVEESKPKPTKRGSIFGGFIKGLKSPTTEKKESELIPATSAKEPETTAVAPKVEETPAPAPVVEAPVATTEAPKEEPKPSATTPHKEKEHFSFGKFLGAAKEKAKSPVGEKAPEKAPETKVEEPLKKEEPVAPIVPVEPVAEAHKEEKTDEEKKDVETTPTTKKRGSIFEKYGEKGLGLFRNASKAGKTKKEEKATAPPKVEEAAEPKEEKIEEPVKPAEKKEETPIADAETKAIGDVVPAAVTVGQAPKSTTEVSATA